MENGFFSESHCNRCFIENNSEPDNSWDVIYLELALNRKSGVVMNFETDLNKLIHVYLEKIERFDELLQEVDIKILASRQSGRLERALSEDRRRIVDLKQQCLQFIQDIEALKLT